MLIRPDILSDDPPDEAGAEREAWVPLLEGSQCRQLGEGKPTLAQISCIRPLV